MSGFGSASQTVQSSRANDFGKRQVPVRSLVASLRPWNNLAAAAVAVEIAPPAGKLAELDSPAYQQLVAESVTAGIEAVRGKLAAAPEAPVPPMTAPGAGAPHGAASCIHPSPSTALTDC